MPTVQGFYAKENFETLTLFLKDVENDILRDFMSYKSKNKDGSWMDGTVMLIVRLHV